MHARAAFRSFHSFNIAPLLYTRYSSIFSARSTSSLHFSVECRAMFPSRPGGPDKKAALLAQAKADRLARSGQKESDKKTALQVSAALRIQSFYRRWSSRRGTKDKLRADWDALSNTMPSTPAESLLRNLKLAFVLLRFYDPLSPSGDDQRLATLCRMLLSKTVVTASEFATAISGGSSPTTMDNASKVASPPISQPSSNPGAKALIQAPFQMILLHSRHANIAAATLLRLNQACISALTGTIKDPHTPTTSPTISKSATLSRKSTSNSVIVQEELYLSGPEMRFVMSFVDINTFRLPGNVGPPIRALMQSRGTELILKILNSGRFYKDIKKGLCLRVEALVQLHERAKKTSITPNETAKQKALTTWITAMWRCCLLLQSVDKERTENTPQSKSAKDNLINLYSDDSTTVGIACHILTVMLFAECLDDLCVQLAWKSRVLDQTLNAILDPRHQSYILSSINLNETLFLLCNLTKLYRLHLAKANEAERAGLRPRVVDTAVLLLLNCQKYVSSTQTTEFRQYHPIFSWTNVAQRNQQISAAQVKIVFSQLEYLWSREFAMATFSPILDLNLAPADNGAIAVTSPLTRELHHDALETSSSATGNGQRSRSRSTTVSRDGVLMSDPQRTMMAIEIQQACLFYVTLMRSFDSQKTRILVTLMYLPGFLVKLWRFMATLGPRGEMRIYLEAAYGNGANSLDNEPLISILQIFCECCARFLITLDDDDMYEQQKPWLLSELVFMSGFLNQFCLSILSTQEDPSSEHGPGISAATPPTIPVATPLPPIFYHARQVLLQIYERDCRRTFCPPNHWLLLHPTKSVFSSPLQLLASLSLSGKAKSSNGNSSSSSGTVKKGLGLLSFSTTSSSSKSPPQYATPNEFMQKVRQKDRTALQILETMPHVIPFTTRLEIFRNFIKEDKSQRAQSLALVRPDLHQSVMVKVRRGYVLEDGYLALGQLSANGWKNTIRVKFTNEVGADEAGIDQGGPFKEFMESFLEAGFSPNLNLFTTTTASMNLLYPSPTASYTHPGTWIELFRLFGKMLGKSMYEGLLVEVKFAGFFLSKILGRTVFLDEMKSFDEEVFRNLMFLKKYEGDVEDLGLTFSMDEEVFGTHRTVELLTGGKEVEVTKENRINYIFQVSDYRLNKQIQEQSRAFIDGFRSIIPLPWISIFSPQELHRVMAGEDVDFDVQDLRAHTEYQNGYFDQHPVIRNLWAALNEFNSEEKRAFLKFVTSCSKPPLGGFKHLYPPFSIRLVMNPTTSDLNHDGSPAPPPRQFGSGSRTSQTMANPGASNPSSHQRSGTSGSGNNNSGGGFGSRFRSAMSHSNSGSSLNGSTGSPPSAPSAFALTSDQHGTPAPMGVVKSFFGGVLGKAGVGSGEAGKKARLPTSSTCFNLLKLPPFSSKSVLKEKLRYAIMSNTGFELS